MTGTPLGKAQIVPREANTAQLADALNQAIRGRSNAVGLCTLANGGTSTVVTAPNCGTGNAVFLFPATANGAAQAGSATPPYIQAADVVQGGFTITHANPGNTTSTFFFLCLG